MYLLNRRNAFRQADSGQGQSAWTFDITKCVLSSKQSILYTNAQDGNVTKSDDCNFLRFYDGGTKLIWHNAGGYLYRNELQTPWDISTLKMNHVGKSPYLGYERRRMDINQTGQILTTDSYEGSKHKAVSSTFESPFNIESYSELDPVFPPFFPSRAKCLRMSVDGKKLFVLCDMNLVVYTLGDMWDLGTASYASMSISLKSLGQNTSNCFKFSHDGYRLLVASNAWIYDYSLRVPWDIRTIQPCTGHFETNFNPIHAFEISDDQQWLYVFDSNTSNVHQYDLHE